MTRAPTIQGGKLSTSDPCHAWLGLKGAGRVRWSRRAFTLLELVAGLVLMATLLVALLLSAARHAQQLKLAQDRQAAVVLADQLLATWHESEAGIPLAGRGFFAARPTWYWQTNATGFQSVFGTSVPVVRLTVVRSDRQTRPAKLLSVDLLRDVKTIVRERQ